MGGYANGGDSDANATSTDPQSRLGGNGGPYVLTAAEISVIVVKEKFAEAEWDDWLSTAEV